MNKLLRHISFALTGVLIYANVSAMTASEYIQKYKDFAIEQMLVYNIPASITLAQGMLESDYGNSPLAVYANNHFGIKCHDDWAGPYYMYDDDEKGEHFRKYSSVDDSYRDHAEFLKSRPWYSFLFEYKRTDYKDWAVGLSKAGYATARDYSKRLISLIEENNLNSYDTVLQSLHGYEILYDPNETPGFSAPQPVVDHIVIQKGDCIYKIARQYCVDVNTLCRVNGLSLNGSLVPGHILYLKSSANQQARYYIVRPGDTVPLIAKQFGIEIKDLCQKNDLTQDSILTPGDMIFL
jgi:LysM repeat protein